MEDDEWGPDRGAFWCPDCEQGDPRDCPHRIQQKYPAEPNWRLFPPRGGVAHVGTWQLKGMAGCWCGREGGHDWPGKAEGAPHPRGDW